MKSFLQFFIESEESGNIKKIKPTIEWMEINYYTLNDMLFHNKLGKCYFQIFTSGKGSEGRTLGRFSCGNKLIPPRISLDTRRMFIPTSGGKKYLDRNNFFQLFKPVISLNGNYSGTEDAWLNTLAHEMIHYETYMDGYAPRQGHGPEFRRECERVAEASNGKFNITRLASAERMQNFDLDDEFKAKRERRAQKKKSRLNAIFVCLDDGKVQLTLTSSLSVINDLVKFNSSGKKFGGETIEKIIMSSDPELIDFLWRTGYKRDFRTYRYWTLPDELSDIPEKYDYEVLWSKVTEDANNEEFLEITPDMDLGLGSPFELDEKN